MHRRRFQELREGDKLFIYISQTRLLDGYGTLSSNPFEGSEGIFGVKNGAALYPVRCRVQLDLIGARQANGAKRTHSAAAFDSSSTEPRLFAHGPPRTNAWGFVRLGCPPADGRRNDGAEPATPSQRAGRINLLFMGRGRAAPDAHLRHRGLGGLWRRIPVTAAWQMCRRIPRACGLAGCDWGAVRKGVGGESGPHSAGQASYQAASAFFS